MYSKLQTLHSQLGALRRSRQLFRWGTGWSAAITSLLWILAGIFILDVIFKMEVLQRGVAIAVGLGLLAWAISKFTSPFLGQRESEIDMALMVERQQGIDSDLVAALQFEGSPEAAKWGSRELENAVIDYVAQLDRGLDVFEGFSRETFWKRAGLLAATVAAVIAFVVIAPQYAKVFLNRLALGSQHYPSDTQIDRVLVNGAEVLRQETHGTSPIDTKSPQSQSVVFAAWASGKMPSENDKEHFLYLYGTGPTGARRITLDGISRDDVEQAYQRQTKTPAEQPAAETSPDVQRLTSFVNTITPVSQNESPAAEDAAAAALSSARLKSLLDQWPSEGAKLYVAKLPRLLDEVKYQVYLGDAWTDPAKIVMVGLPQVSMKFTDKLPEYAQGVGEGDEQVNAPESLQRSVIEGSSIDLVLESDKPLKTATLTLLGSRNEPPKDFALRAIDEKKLQWTLPEKDSPLAKISRPLSFELQVVDEDELSLEKPLSCAVRMKADRTPRIMGGTINRIVKPTSKPEIELRASDDFGIGAMSVRVDVTERGKERVSADALETATFKIDKLLPLSLGMNTQQRKARVAQPVKFPARGESIMGAYKLDLSSMKLTRGDTVSITLVAEDYRGEGRSGETAESEPIILEIGDESGVVGVIADGDRRSSEQIDALIERQLGIGQSPK